MIVNCQLQCEYEYIFHCSSMNLFRFYIYLIIIVSMALQHDALECCASARASVRNNLKCIGHFLEFCPEEHLGLVSSRIHRWIKKVVHIFTLSKLDRKFQCEFDVVLHGTDDDRELMARYNARHEPSGLAEFYRNVSRLRKAIRKALVNRSRE